MKIIFLHPHKTGGTAVIRKFNIVRTHRTYKSINFFSKDILKNNFKDILLNLRLLNQPKPEFINTKTRNKKLYYIGIVRNPYRRICSWFNNVKNDKFHQKRFNYNKNMDMFEFIQKNENSLPLKPMTYWFTDWSGNLIIDKFIRNENLQNDLNIILKELDYRNINLEYINRAKKEYNYKKILDENSISWIANNHHEDFKNFGYSKEI